ncbi:hypothetical protein ACFQV4_28535 [Streptomyces thermocarboxydus]
MPGMVERIKQFARSPQGAARPSRYAGPRPTPGGRRRPSGCWDGCAAAR